MDRLKQCFMNFIQHLRDEKILEIDMNIFLDKNMYESVLLLKDLFKEHFPKTKLKKVMKSIHYANGFKDEELRQSAYLLDEIQQYLTGNHFLNHDESVAFFNKKITEEGFVITSESLFKIHLESLLLSVNDH
ncbi:hypothetical protein E4O00_12860 [Treponema sp. OMZ 788]|uniref:hypothetical protein n=1 Tax=Treponema sp. OMZ 788 TaxID=2563664 RepID=UPI0020A395CC|nr:hypothetical protein [Treponema sp. OMZ 788]UTC64622.1 hypothetical protein E4O00_12860 [Treponema sp. OMZ 788]